MILVWLTAPPLAAIRAVLMIVVVPGLDVDRSAEVVVAMVAAVLLVILVVTGPPVAAVPAGVLVADAPLVAAVVLLLREVIAVVAVEARVALAKAALRSFRRCSAACLVTDMVLVLALALFWADVLRVVVLLRRGASALAVISYPDRTLWSSIRFCDSSRLSPPAPLPPPRPVCLPTRPNFIPSVDRRRAPTNPRTILLLLLLWLLLLLLLLLFPPRSPPVLARRPAPLVKGRRFGLSCLSSHLLLLSKARWR